MGEVANQAGITGKGQAHHYDWFGREIHPVKRAWKPRNSGIFPKLGHFCCPGELLDLQVIF
ncbi:hypothetical protein DTL21_19885 [Bremerella cremea]|uniref:Uncharacterized protein n=1 Tax=Blastopirellula marina TaxID=124 RepID=A0A2S8FJX3_9BACT|nr:hypothetical protein C5Y83_19865 [Blastopirellula marina]RCS45542.1 hypothetical protein DTL21_19885 [Bremerella cremea]